jgi:glycosyltransferase involved in cell wall biosynthesis
MESFRSRRRGSPALKILLLSKAPLNGLYQKTLEELARLPGVNLLAVVPPYWCEERVGVVRLERRYTEGYRLVEVPMVFNGHHHVHLYPRLWTVAQQFRPDILHVEEEPYNTVTAHAALIGGMVGAKVVFVSWQNLFRRYPPPFSLFERLNYRSAAAAIAGSHDAAAILRRKGYRRRFEVIPQLGVDPDLYHPLTEPNEDIPEIGFAGRLVPEKGADILLDAFARLKQRARLQIIGDGTERTALQHRATNLGIRDRVRLRGTVAPADMPKTLGSLDILVVRSRTRKNWKEQFGRVIIEAMACQIPVVGSDSGEIPNVIGDASLVFPEANADALANLLDDLLMNSTKRLTLGRQARKRVLAHYTPARIAERAYMLYRELLTGHHSEATTCPQPAERAGP